MTFQGDPYRTLGVAPAASLNEIRSAYRRLAKQYHPDAAGERALPRFLAIQAAYEQLVDGEGRLRGGSAFGAGPRTGGRPSEPWRADPARARASRDAWRARRSGAGGGASPGGAGASGAGASGTGASGTGAPGATGGTSRPRAGERGGERPGGARDRPPRRGPRKATPGSTTYDEAKDGPREPEWEGGSWYGPNSRTYWTINPREYADPRKHGPEYQARARRATSADDAAGEPVADPGWGWAGAGPSTTDGGTGEGGGGAWRYEMGEVPGGGAMAGEARARASSGSSRSSFTSAAWRAAPSADDAVFPDLEAIARRASPLNLLATARRPDRRWRLLLAVVGWPPLGYFIGTLLSTVTGCASFAATCPGPVPALSMLVQPVVVAGLFLAPPVAALAAFASIVALAVAVPVAAVLSVGTVPESRVGASVLGAIVTVAYLVALVSGGVELWRPSSGRGADSGDDGAGDPAG